MLHDPENCAICKEQMTCDKCGKKLCTPVNDGKDKHVEGHYHFDGKNICSDCWEHQHG